MWLAFPSDRRQFLWALLTSLEWRAGLRRLATGMVYFGAGLGAGYWLWGAG